MGIVSDALSYVGKVEYKFGRNDIPGGVGDCSAFTQYIYGMHGYTIGRDTRAQLEWAKKHGKEIPYFEILPGDIVFFKGTYRPGVSHVGIATGGGKMVNLQNDGVIHEKITQKWGDGEFMAAYRFADAEDVGTAADESGGDRDDVTNTGNGVTGTSGLASWGLDWWGDIVTVVVIVGCIALGLFFMYKAFAAQISGALPSLDSIGAAMNKMKPEGSAE